MDKDKFLEKITEIGTIEDDAKRRTILAELSDEVTKVFDDVSLHQATIDTLNQTIQKDKDDMDKLREYNMELFKRVPVSKTNGEIKGDSLGIKDDPPRRKFEDLFDEKGGLKK